MKLVEREDKTESISGTDIDMEPVFDKQVKELLKKQNGFAWPYYLISPQKYEAETMISLMKKIEGCSGSFVLYG